MRDTSRDNETRGFAAATLVCLANDTAGRLQINSAGGASVLMPVATGPESWLRGQCVQVLNLLGHPDPLSSKSGSPGSSSIKPFSPRPPARDGVEQIAAMTQALGYSEIPHIELRYQSNPKPCLKEYTNPYAGYMPTSPRSPRRLSPDAGGVRLSTNTASSASLLAQFQAKLAQNPTLSWMMQEKSSSISDDHLVEIASQFKARDRVIVPATETFTKSRKAIIAYVGKVPEIAPGFWVGVQYEEAHGKNDGSLDGTRYFKCAADHGSFLRPNRIEKDPDAISEDPAALSELQDPAAEGTATDAELVLGDRGGIVGEDTGSITQDVVVESNRTGRKKGSAKIDLPKEPKPRAPTARMGDEPSTAPPKSKKLASPKGDKPTATASKGDKTGPSSKPERAGNDPVLNVGSTQYERTQMRQAMEVTPSPAKSSPSKSPKKKSARSKPSA